jgi:predicted amidohydrolase
VTLRVALTQWAAGGDVAENVATAVSLIADAAVESPDLVLLPENSLCLGTNAQMRAAALHLESDEIAALQEAARRAGSAVILGGLKRLDDTGAVFNSALVIDRDGMIAGHYDKIHLFNATVGGRTFDAASVERAGDCPVLADIAGARVGLTICYDVRFPELYRGLARAGAEVLLVPAAFVRATGEAHWEVLLRARAIENAAFVVASATVHDPDAVGVDVFPTYGHALAVDPWGRVLADLGAERRAWQVVELDLSEVEQIRTALPALRSARPDVYAREPIIVQVT